MKAFEIVQEQRHKVMGKRIEMLREASENQTWQRNVKEVELLDKEIQRLEEIEIYLAYRSI